MKSNGERILAYAEQRKQFTPQDVRDELDIPHTSVSGAIGQLVHSGQLIVIEKGVYRAMNRKIKRELERLVLFGKAGRVA
ncbi:hypothetical protein GCM10022421_08760 [Oceanisphaera sediminis]|uniref:AbiEi antitoxin N-terminal domain-containing protein n=1 Tax=Oceanisphaera sediminis TaxID=981381 RepID=A0ABP7DGC4_9GAMM